jgi:ABC-type multidrug transport system ATPase subunit
MSNLHVDSIAKTYNGNPVLSDVFLSCNPGEIIGILGRNGSGKSTLLKIIFGTEPAENRFVRVGGKIIGSVSDTRNLISFLPQEGFLPKGVRVKTSIDFFLPRASGEALCENGFLKPLLHKKTHTLSNGERRITEVLMIVHAPSKFLLLDEPFNGVSPVIREELMQILRSCKGHKGILTTDHDFERILKLADKIVLLKDGSTRHLEDASQLVKYGYLSRERYDLMQR